MNVNGRMPASDRLEPRIQELLRQGKRQLARACAHEAMDGRLPSGMAAAAAVACAEGFDDLAATLFARQPEDAIPEFVAARWTALLRGVERDDALASRLLAAQEHIRSLDWHDRWTLIDAATASGRMASLRALLKILQEDRSTAAQSDAAALARIGKLLATMGVVQATGEDPTPAASADGWSILVVCLPPFEELGRSGDRDAGSGAASFIRGLQQAQVGRPGGRWARRALASIGLPWVGAPLQAWRLNAAADSLPRQAAQTLVFVLDAVLDRHNAWHWLAALGQWRDVVIAGLEVHDPAALGSEIVSALRRHQPVGVADVSSQFLLTEHGVDSYVSGRAGDAMPAHSKKAALWRDGAPTARGRIMGDSVLAAWRQRPADLPCTLRRALASSSADEVRSGMAGPAWQLPACSVDPEALASRLRQRRVELTGQMRTDATVDIALSVDQHLAEFLPVVIESCLDGASRPLRFHILMRGISTAQCAQWGRQFSGRAFLDGYSFDDVGYGSELNLISHTTVSTLDRLMLPLLLDELDRVIYLDIDLVVLGDIFELWNMDLQGYALAAKPSTSPGTRYGIQMLYQALGALPLDQARPIRQWLHDTGPMGFRAFNAGVMVLDLCRMRRDAAVPLLLSLVQHAAMNDQDALNAYARGAFRHLDTCWNAAPRQDDTQGAKIIHFVGPVKPWHDIYISRKYEFQRFRDRVAHDRRQLGLA